MRTFIHEEGLAFADGMNVDLVRLKIVRKRLFDINNTIINFGMIGRDPVKDFIHVAGVGHHTIKVGSEVGDVFFEADVTNFNKPLKIPLEVVATKFDFEAF